MSRFLGFIDRSSDWVGRVGSILLVILFLAITYDITIRYFFSVSQFWAYDLTYMIFGIYSMLGMAYCLQKNAHVRMDLLSGRLSERGRAIMDIVGYLLFFFPLMIVIVYKCGGNAITAFQHGECSPSSSWRPSLVPFKFIIEFGFVLFLLQGLVQFLRSLSILLKSKKES